MRILFNDVVQYSDAESTIKSPMLSEMTEIKDSIVINFDEPRRINAIGIGNAKIDDVVIYDGDRADAIYPNELIGGSANSSFTNSANGGDALLANFTVSFNDAKNTSFSFRCDANGLYPMNRTVLASKMVVTTTSPYVGRIAAGIGVHIPTSVAKEPSFNSTSEPRVTLSGQSIHGAGGYNYNSISLDSRYKMDEFAMRELRNGFKHIGMGYPFFIDLTDESYKLPFNKFYGAEKNQRSMSFEGGILKYLYSKRWVFEERF